MLVGYARTSSLAQVAGLEAQERGLLAAGCEKVFREQVSSVAQRDQLEAALDYVREGDSFIVTKLDRLARSMIHLGEITALLEKKKVGLRIQNLNLDSGTPTGRLMLNLLGSVAQFEREIMGERQREGIAKAKAEGRYRGRKPTARAKSAEVIRLADEGLQRTEIAERLEIGIASVYRVLGDAKKACW